MSEGRESSVTLPSSGPVAHERGNLIPHLLLHRLNHSRGYRIPCGALGVYREPQRVREIVPTPQPPTPDPLGPRVARGGAWLAGAQAISGLLTFGALMFLAGILTPEDFGIVTIGMLIASATTVGLSFGIAELIQTADPHLERSVLGFALVVGALSTLLVLLAAPFVARLLGDANATPFIVALSPIVLMRRWSEARIGVMERRLAFRPVALAKLSGALVGSASGVVAALAGAGAWAMVGQFLLTEAITFAIVALYPMMPRSPIFSLRELKIVSRSGREFLGNSLVVFAYNNLDDAGVSRWIGTPALGLYNFAYRIANIPVELFTRVVSRALLPAFRELEERGRHWREPYVRSLKLLSWASSLVSFGILLHGPTLLNAVYGDRWTASYTALRILAVYGVFRAVAATSGTLFIASRRPSLVRKIAQWQTLTMLLILVPALEFWGIAGAAIAVTAPLVVAACYALVRASRFINVPISSVVRVVGGSWAGTLVANLVGIPVRSIISGWAGLLVAGAIVLTVALLHGTFTLHGEFKRLRSYFSSRRSNG